jgi:hypothetical protein
LPSAGPTAAGVQADGLEEAAIEENSGWMTTRRIKAGTSADFERTWRPERHPEGMLYAYAYWR